MIGFQKLGEISEIVYTFSYQSLKGVYDYPTLKNIALAGLCSGCIINCCIPHYA